MDSKERNFTLARLRSVKSYWLARKNKDDAEVNSISDNVVPFPTNNEQLNGDAEVNSIPDNVVLSPDGDGQQRGTSKKMGSHPGTGNVIYWDPNNNNTNNDYISKAGFTSGLVLGAITFVMETLFLLVSYFIFK